MLLIHSEHDFTRAYQDYHIISDDFKYSSQWKDENKKTESETLYPAFYQKIKKS